MLLGDCDVPVVDLLLTDDSDEIVVGGEGSSDLLGNSIVSLIDVGGVALEDESVGDLVSELLVLFRDGDDDDLTRREPEGPFSSGLLGEDSDESLEGPDDGSVHDDGAGVSGLEVVLLEGELLLLGGLVGGVGQVGGGSLVGVTVSDNLVLAHFLEQVLGLVGGVFLDSEDVLELGLDLDTLLGGLLELLLDGLLLVEEWDLQALVECAIVLL